MRIAGARLFLLVKKKRMINLPPLKNTGFPSPHKPDYARGSFPGIKIRLKYLSVQGIRYN
jgi:hypothetical protein